jgi:hypothetical protein
MCKSWDIDTNESVEYDEFLEFFRAQGKHLFENDLDASALMMRRLANNRRFLTERLNREMANLKTFQTKNLYTPQVFMLDMNDIFFVRANIWEPLKKRPGDDLFFYEAPHDHNFSFLTVGYHGSGYSTELYDYDHDKVIGYVDEPVDLRVIRKTTLPYGRVLFFRQSVDVHTQLPPEELSISVNVLRRPPMRGGVRPDQYYFDADKRTIAGKADEMTNAELIRLAGAVGDGNTLDILAKLASEHACRRTRLAAYEVVATRTGAGVWEKAADDADALVRHVANERLRLAEKAA